MNKKSVWILLILLFFLAGAAGSYFFLKSFSPAVSQTAPGEPSASEDLVVLRMFYPKGTRLEMIEKKLPRRTRNTAIAESVIEDYFRAAGSDSPVPQHVKVLGIYRDQNQTLYVDLSDEVRRNFQGDALSEYLILKGMHESLVANVQDINDIKILVEGKEIESLGGHFYLKYPLRYTVTHEPEPGERPSHDQE
jgi:hypothetical protein